MKKVAYFDELWGDVWPDLEWLKGYFLTIPVRKRYFDSKGRDGRFTLEGIEGTGHLERNKGRIDIDLYISGQQELGILLYYRKSGSGIDQSYFSMGDLSRSKTWFHDRYGTALPLGLFIPFEPAWRAVKEFIETEGKLPKSIEWIAQRDLPPGTFSER